MLALARTTVLTSSSGQPPGTTATVPAHMVPRSPCTTTKATTQILAVFPSSSIWLPLTMSAPPLPPSLLQLQVEVQEDDSRIKVRTWSSFCREETSESTHSVIQGGCCEWSSGPLSRFTHVWHPVICRARFRPAGDVSHHKSIESCQRLNVKEEEGGYRGNVNIGRGTDRGLSSLTNPRKSSRKRV
ncbi:hypothetical protein AMECASPLE_021251 [Ameca splendens]|uniref:Uncharacterized protein n=1 Tax=Ameca splendens TaxID=208324 RepID=A0ABV0ZDB2_9TELE